MFSPARSRLLNGELSRIGIGQSEAAGSHLLLELKIRFPAVHHSPPLAGTHSAGDDLPDHSPTRRSPELPPEAAPNPCELGLNIEPKSLVSTSSFHSPFDSGLSDESEIL